MATAQKLHLRRGQIAFIASAYRREGSVHHGGIPLDTPGAEVEMIVAKVLKRTRKETTVQVLWTNAKDEVWQAGAVRDIDRRFHNYVAEGDERLTREMERAGVSIKIALDPTTGEEKYSVAFRSKEA